MKPEWKVFLNQLSVEVERGETGPGDEDLLDAAANVAAGATFHRLTQEKGWGNGRAFALCTDFVRVIREKSDEEWADELERAWLDHR